MAKKKTLRRLVLGEGVLGSRFNQKDHVAIVEWRRIIGEYDWAPTILKYHRRIMFNADKPGRLVFEFEE